MKRDCVTTVEHGPVNIQLADGTILFTKYTKTVTRTPRRAVLGGVEQVIDMGSVRLGPSEDWIRHPDGREERGSHMAAMMRSVKKPKKTRMGKYKSWLARKLCAFLGHNWDCVEYAGPVNLPWGTKYRCKRCKAEMNPEERHEAL